MTTETIKKPLWCRLALPMLSGALAGGLASFAFLELVEAGQFDGLGRSREIAGLVGVLYALIGLMVILGALSPGVGAKFLNVEDADELREQRRMLVLSAAAMSLFGAALVLLAISGEGAFVSAQIGAVGAVGLILVASWLSIRMQRLIDELQRALSSDATTTGFYLLFFIGGGWAVAAHLEFVPGPQPLDWITMFAVFMLVGSFWQTARRGLMTRGPN